MNIHRRFVVLVIGAVLTPPITAALLFAIFNDAPAPAGLREFMHGERTVQEAQEVTRSLAPNVKARVFTADDLAALGIGVTAERGAADSGAFPQTFTIMVKPLVDDTGAVDAAGARAALVVPLPVSPSRLRAVAALSVAIIFLFTSGVAIVTVRAIRRSLRVLERATASVASGTLDFEIDIAQGDSFYPLAQSFDRMRTRIREEQDRRTRFFMGVSHDLKTPLASITGYADALIEGYGQDAAARERYLRIIRDKAQLLQTRISRLIEYVKHATGEFQASLVPRDLAAFLGEFAAFQMEEAELKGHALEAEVSLPSPLMVPFDPDLLSRALENVLSNALQYGTPRANATGETHTPVRLTAATDATGKSIRIVCTNRLHAPLSAATRERLFDPFFRADPARSGEGFGLGLASAKAIVENHGWTIGVQTNADEFRIEVVIPMMGTEPAAVD